MQHAQNVGPNLFTHIENSAYVMPHVTACAVMSCMHHVVHAHKQAGCPYKNVACQKLLIDMAFVHCLATQCRFSNSWLSSYGVASH